MLLEVRDPNIFRERLHPEDLASFDAERLNRNKTEPTWQLDYRIVLPDGSIRHAHTVAHPVIGDSGEFVEFIGITMDVTERQRAEEALQRAKNRFRAMVEKSAEGILLMRPEKGVVYASPSVERVIGYTPEELTGQSVQSLTDRLVHVDYRQQQTDNWTQLLQDPDHEVTTEVMLRHKDGSFRWIESTTRNLLH
jgi:PAS domain S-box-containing protein